MILDDEINLTKTQHMLKDIKSLSKDVTNRGAAALVRLVIDMIYYSFFFFIIQQNFRTLTKKKVADVHRTFTKNNTTISPFSMGGFTSLRCQRIGEKRTTQDVLTQIVSLQREQKREIIKKKRGNNYDSDESCSSNSESK